MTPEQKARVEVDKKLSDSGWVLQDKKEFNPAATPGVAVREFTTDSGPVDYLLFVDRKPVGIIEAKKSAEGQNMTVFEAQSERYATSSIKWAVSGQTIRFAYEATDIITRFTDYADVKSRSREVLSFHRPETLREWMASDDTIRNRMKTVPIFEDTQKRFRDCQTAAIQGLERSFAGNRPRALIQMATGAGKTYTAITAVYRLLKYVKVKRVLFLVDTRNLGRQAETEFIGYMPNDETRRFSELYDVRRLRSGNIPSSSQVCISTIQRMYSILKGEDLDESSEEENPNEHDDALKGKPREVVYNAKYPPEFFDVIIIDECHRSIYNIWQQVLDYFDAFQIGLTATPDKRTFGYFAENDEITALTILYNGAWRARPLTLQMVEEVYAAIKKRHLSTERLWSAYSYVDREKVKAKSPVSKLIDIVSLLRFELGITTELAPYSDTVNYNFMRWTMAKNAGPVQFTSEQVEWLRMVKDFIASSMAITAADLDLAPFNRYGGLGKFYSLFGDGFEKLLDEMNLALTA